MEEPGSRAVHSLCPQTAFSSPTGQLGRGQVSGGGKEARPQQRSDFQPPSWGLWGAAKEPPCAALWVRGRLKAGVGEKDLAER